jgi:hypothetical protein
MVQTKTYKATPGRWYISDPALFGVRLLGVWRENLTFKRVPFGTIPGWPEFYFVAGRITFDPAAPFIGTVGDGIMETVVVMFDSGSRGGFYI